MDSICSAQHPLGKSIWAPSAAAWTRGTQRLKGCKMYSLSIFFFVTYKTCSFIKPFVVDIHNEPCSVPLSLHLTSFPVQNNLLCLFLAPVTLLPQPAVPRTFSSLPTSQPQEPAHRKTSRHWWDGVESKYRGLKDSVTHLSVFALHLHFSNYSVFLKLCKLVVFILLIIII